MVFKGRFFSSKKSDTSSPDGSSNSPRSLGSNFNSPIRLEKKKPKSLSPSVSKDSSSSAAADAPSRANTPTSTSKSLLKRKDSKGRDTPSLNKPTTEILKNSSPAPSNLKKSSETAAPAAGPTSASFSPILASSLGLNKIKTRSGPLPQESFFSFGSRDKGVPLGSSNLSRPLGSRGVLDGGDVGKKKKEKPLLENVENGSNSDGMSTESGPSRDRSPHVSIAQARSRLQNGESSSGDTGIHLYFHLMRSTDFFSLHVLPMTFCSCVCSLIFFYLNTRPVLYDDIQDWN